MLFRFHVGAFVVLLLWKMDEILHRGSHNSWTTWLTSRVTIGIRLYRLKYDVLKHSLRYWFINTRLNCIGHGLVMNGV